MTTQNKIPTDRYWASVEAEELAAVVAAKCDAFRGRLERDGHVDVWRRSERTYYGLDGEGGWATSAAVQFGGDEGELVLARVNHYRSIIQAAIAMVTGQRPAFTGVAINADVASLEAATLAKGVVEWIYRSKRIEDLRVEQVERALVSGEGYMHLRWDVHAGRVVEQRERPVLNERGDPLLDDVEVADPETGLVVTQQQERTERYPVREGDIAPEVLGPLQVVRDLNAREMRWAIVPHRENVWDLAARYPQLRQHLIALRGHEQWSRRVWGDATQKPDEDDDTIVVWCLYHLPCDALPKGRYALVAGEHVLADEPWRFGDEVPVYELVPMRQMDTAMGYSPMWDLLCLQELYDATITALASQHDALGIQNIIAPKGSELSPEMIARGLQLIEYEVVEGVEGGGKPEALSLLEIAQDSYKLEEIYKRTMETLSGINSVARGEPSSNLKSGAALALVQSLATHFNSTTQALVTRNDERVGTGSLKLYQRFSPIPRLAEVVGKRNRSALREFTGQQLEGVQRMHVETTSPLLRGAGLVDIGQQQLQAGAMTLPEFFELVDTGRIEPILEKVSPDETRDETRQVMSENEDLASGQRVTINSGDRDDIHVRHHRRVMDDPETRKNPAIARAVFVHTLEHLAQAGHGPSAQRLAELGVPPPPVKSAAVMWMIGQTVPPFHPEAMGAPTGEEDAPAGGPPQPSAGPAPREERAPVLGQPGPSDGPLMPTNPLTGERADPSQQVM